MRSFLVHRFAVTLPRTLKLLQGGWDVSGALKTLATCRMAGAIRISPYRHGRLTGNYLPGCAIRLPSFELCRRRRPTHLARALARPVQNDRKKHTDHPVCFIAYFKLFSTNLTNMAEPTGMQASSTINFGW